MFRAGNNQILRTGAISALTGLPAHQQSSYFNEFTTQSELKALILNNNEIMQVHGLGSLRNLTSLGTHTAVLV